MENDNYVDVILSRCMPAKVDVEEKVNQMLNQ